MVGKTFIIYDKQHTFQLSRWITLESVECTCKWISKEPKQKELIFVPYQTIAPITRKPQQGTWYWSNINKVNNNGRDYLKPNMLDHFRCEFFFDCGLICCKKDCFPLELLQFEIYHHYIGYWIAIQAGFVYCSKRF